MTIILHSDGGLKVALPIEIQRILVLRKKLRISFRIVLEDDGDELASRLECLAERQNWKLSDLVEG